MLMPDTVPWSNDFYDPILFDAGAGDADSDMTIAFYRSQLTGAPRRILDIGCGTGRLSLPLIEDGHCVHGLDTSAAMLSRLEAKAERLPLGLRGRLSWELENFLAARPAGEFDALVAADDFVTHFDLAALDRFFLQARHALPPGGMLLTDLRERGSARLTAAAAAFPKAMQTHGLVGGISTETGDRHVAMMGWEEYDVASRCLTSHQLYSFIRPDGTEDRRVWRTIHQYNHTNSQLVNAARGAGFAVQQAIGRQDAAAFGEQGGFFCLLRE